MQELSDELEKQLEVRFGGGYGHVIIVCVFRGILKESLREIKLLALLSN